MQLQEKPLSVKQKTIAMYQGKFYLPPKYSHELVSLIETGQIVTNRQAVDFIDAEGEWFQ